MADLPVGSTFGGFRIEGVLRQEELGAVYRATQLGLGRSVALKVLAPERVDDPMARERFRREVRLAAANNAPGAPLVYEVGEHDGRPFVAMGIGQPEHSIIEPAAVVPPPAPVTVPPAVTPAQAALTQVRRIPVQPGPAPEPPKPGPRFPWFALVFALLAVGAAVAAVMVLGGDDDKDDGGGQQVSFNDPAATTTAKPDADTEDGPTAKPEPKGPARVTDSIKVGDMPDGLSVGDGAVWVTNKGDGNLVRINPDTRKVTETVFAGAGPDSVLAAGGQVYVTTQDDGGHLQRFRTRPLLKRIGDGTFLGPDPESLSLDGDSFWVSISGLDQVRRVDLATGDLVGRPFAVGDAPVGVDADGDRVWVANTGSGSVTMLRKGAGSTEIPVGQNPRELVVSDGFVWVVLTDEDAVVRLSATTGIRVGPPIRVGANPHKIAAGFGSLWVTNTRDATVSQIDARSFKVVKTLPVDETPLGIAAGAGAVWVGARDAGTVVRIEP